MKKKMINKLLWVLSVALTVFFFVCLVYTVMPPEPETRDFDYEGNFRLYSIEEYNDFVNGNTRLPQNFVTADMLLFLGKFESVWFMDGENLNNYRYTLKNSSGEKILFSVYEEPWTHIEELSASEDGKVFLEFTDSQFRYLDYGKFRYLYHGNRLYWIEWTANGVWYQINREAFYIPPLFDLRHRDIETQQKALDLFPDFVADADRLDLPISKIEVARLVNLALLLAACILSWHFVKVRRPVWYKEGMKL